MPANPMLSIISPVYNTGSMLAELVNRIDSSVSTIFSSYEIILIDDGSADSSWQIVKTLSSQFRRVTGIRLSRNFGQHAAIAAGLHNARGEWIVVMDSDLQDQPECIPQLFAATKNGSLVVLAKRMERRDSLSRKLGSKIFYWMLNRLSDLPANHAIANFGIYHRRVIDEILKMEGTHRFFPMMVAWTGFPTSYVDCAHDKRSAGESGYSMKKLIRLALHTTLSYSDKPLRYIVKAGMLISLLSVIYAAVILIRYFTGHIVVLGYTSIIVSIWFTGGLILFTLGIVGLYVGRIFEQVKQRPSYIIHEKTTDGSPL